MCYLALSSIPKIVCEAISSLDLQDEVPSWKIMESRGRITIVLTWDQRQYGPTTSSGASTFIVSPVLPVCSHPPAMHGHDTFARRISPTSLSPSPQPTCSTLLATSATAAPGLQPTNFVSSAQSMI